MIRDFKMLDGTCGFRYDNRRTAMEVRRMERSNSSTVLLRCGYGVFFSYSN